MSQSQIPIPPSSACWTLVLFTLLAVLLGQIAPAWGAPADAATKRHPPYGKILDAGLVSVTLPEWSDAAIDSGQSLFASPEPPVPSQTTAGPPPPVDLGCSIASARTQKASEAFFSVVALVFLTRRKRMGK